MDDAVLFVASVYSHIRGFHMPYLHMLRDKGFDTLVAAGGDSNAKRIIQAEGFRCIDVPFSRNPSSSENLRAFTKLCSVFQNMPQIKLVHVHTPVAAFVTRLSSRRVRFTGQMLYTAHGFHFYHGASVRNWLVFYPLEAFAARYTDGIITINREDFHHAGRFRLKPNGHVHYVPGVGVDILRYSYQGDLVRQAVRTELGIGTDDVVMTCVAEVNDNKNHIQLLRALTIVREQCPSIRLLVIGEGSRRGQLEEYVRYHGLGKNVSFLGRRDDIPRLLTASDIAALASLREGLPRFLMEAAAAGLPFVCTDIRGTRDIVTDGLNGYLVPIGDHHRTAQRIARLAGDALLRREMGRAAADAVKRFSLDEVLPAMDSIYERYLYRT